jgi:hypothetical protein
MAAARRIFGRRTVQAAAWLTLILRLAAGPAALTPIV